MTRQFYKPPKGFSALLFLGVENLWGDFCFIGPQTVRYSDYWIAVCSSWERKPRLFPFGGKLSGFPKIYAPLFNQPFGFVYTFGTAKREPNRREKRENLSRKRVSPFRLHRLPAHTQSNLLADSPTGSRLYQGFSRTLNPRAEFAVNRIARLAFLHGFLWSYSPSVLVRPLYPLYNGLP